MASAPPPSGDDRMQQWIAEARNGSRAAMNQLLDDCRQYLLLAAQRQLPVPLQARGSASDLVQNTLLEAFRDFDQFRGASRPELEAWLQRIFKNNLLNFIRAQRAGMRDPAAEVAPGKDAEGRDLVDGLLADSETPGRIAQAAETDRALHAALAQLPERARQAIHWRGYERLPFDEIGERLGCSADAARKVWARAIEDLQELLGPTDESG